MRTASPYSASITGGGFLFNEKNALLSSLINEMSIVRKRPVQKTSTSQGTSRGTSQGKGTKSEIADNQTNIKDNINNGTKSEVPSQGKGTKSGVPSQDKGTKSRTENVLSTSRKDGHTVIEGNIIAFCSKPRSLKEIAEYLGVSAFKKVKTRYINGLLKEGRLSMTVPDKPTSRFQKYVAI